MFALLVLSTIVLGWGISELIDDDQENAEDNGPEESEIVINNEQFDYLTGNDAENTIFGGSSNDFIAGGEGDDRLFGGDDDDDIFGGSGDDFIRGGADDDYIFGSKGNDTLHGDAGNDIVVGADFFEEDTYLDSVRDGQPPIVNIDNRLEEAEADTLFGGAGDDALFVGGNDVATTGSGADVVSTGLWMEAGETAVVTDFEQGVDVIAYNFDRSEPDPTISFSENDDGDAQLRVNGDVILVLQGVDFSSLSTSDVRLFAA